MVGYPSMPTDQQFGQEIVVEQDGRGFLRWNSRTWALDSDGVVGRPLGTESGFWRVLGPSGVPADDAESPSPLSVDAPGPATDSPAPPPAASPAPTPTSFDVELLLTHPTGILEMYAGTATGARIDLATDVVMRSPAAKEYSAARRLYGMVDGDLLWAMDMAAQGYDLTPHASGRLHRVT